jgi:hypothetical protein
LVPVALIASARELTIPAASACEAAARLASPRWEVQILGRGEAPDGLAWLFPDVPIAWIDDPSEMLASARLRAGIVSADPDVERALSDRPGGIGPFAPRVVVVGPDGAPLWRGGELTVPRLRDAGYEPEGVRRFVALGGDDEPCRFLSHEGLERANREAVLALDPDVRARRLDAALRAGGLSLDAERFDLAWRALRPKIRRLGDAPVWLAFLRPEWRRPLIHVSPSPWAEGARHAAHVAGPEELLDLLGVDLGARPRHRRLMRWALTGQTLAPRLVDVWALLGSEEALRRLAGAGEDTLECRASGVIGSP